MRPGDHPEFFRFPAPEGVSRESTIVLDAEGRFWHDGVRVERATMTRAFASWIRRHPDDDRFILSNDYDWTYFTVVAVPFFVERIEFEGDVVRATLFDGSRETLDSTTLRLGPGDRVSCRVKSGKFEAQLSRSAQLALGEAVFERPDGGLGLRVGNVEMQLNSDVEYG